MRCALVGLVLITVVVPLRADEPRDIVERAIKAQGGAAVLDGWTGTRMSHESHSDTVKSHGFTLYGTPDRQKVEFRLVQQGVELPFDIVVVVADGKGWMWRKIPGQQPEAATELEPQTMLAINAKDAVHETRVSNLLPLVRDRQFTLTALPESSVADRPAVGVRASYPGYPDVALFFDKETHLLVKSSYQNDQGKQTPDGKPVMILHEVLFKDYREMGADEERLLNQAGIKTDRKSLRAYLETLRPDPVLTAKARTLVKRLGDDSFEVREKASEELIAVGPPALVVLQEAARNEDREVARRATICLETITARTNRETTRAGVRLLVLRAPDVAAETLLALLPSAEEGVVEDIRAALVPLAQRPGGPDAALLRALEDKEPARRDAARAVLGKDGGEWLNRPGRRLLLPGVLVSFRRAQTDTGQEGEDTVTDLFNRLDDKEFARP
jgi:hypothetical protein